MTIGEKIRNLRKKAGWTQEALALKVGVSPNLVSKWEKSDRFPSIESVEKLSACFDQTVHYFAPEKSQLIELRVFQSIQNDKFVFDFDDWKNKFRYDKVAAYLINNDIFEEDVTKFTQAEIDERYFLFKDEHEQQHIIRYDFKRIVSKRYYALREGESLIVRQLFSMQEESFYTVHVDSSILENVIHTVKDGGSLKLDTEDIIKMQSFNAQQKDLIVGLIVTSIRTIK